MQVNINSSWNALIENERKKSYFKKLEDFLNKEYSKYKCYPSRKDIFKAFELCPIEKTKVVILGQDPYINPEQAMGLSFSVPESTAIPPSLRNIFKELGQSSGINKEHGDLTNWANQGVFLLNSVLTVRAGESHSHSKHGWEIFTDQVMHELAANTSGIVFMLWGAHAQKKAKFLNPNTNLILNSPHPSPLSAYRGFFGSNHFNLCNEYLANQNKQIIQW